MSDYFVIGPTGEKFGPATVTLLNEWATQNRVTVSTVVEEVATGARMPVTSIPGIMIQPQAPQAYADYQRPYEQVPNHLVKSILSSLCGCHLLGIVAIVFAAQVDGHARRGDMVMARESSRKANLFANISLSFVVLYLIYYIFIIVMAVSSGGSSRYR